MTIMTQGGYVANSTSYSIRDNESHWVLFNLQLHCEQAIDKSVIFPVTWNIHVFFIMRILWMYKP